jgi:hypothetical protein
MFLGIDYERVAKQCSGMELVYAGLVNSREEYIAGLFEVEIVFRDVAHLDRSRPAVLTVPSLNSGSGQTHAVYWDGQRIWDPNHGRSGKKSYTNQAAWELCTEGYQRRA